jgi:spermidine/putrescine transport system substrate-binding protein
VVPTDFMVGRLIELGWLSELNDANIPNSVNLRPQLLNAAYDSGRKYSLPWVSGMVGLAYNRAATGRDITGVDDLFNEEFKGRVSLLSDLRDGVGMIMLYQGNDPADATSETVQQAVDAIAEQSDSGQIRRFTGNDYGDDLAAGNLVIAETYSGDVAQLLKDNPDLRFVIPESGGTLFSDNMVIPYTTQNQAAAEAWMNWIYDKQNYAQLISEIQYIPALDDMTDALAAISPEVANNPLINPSPATLETLKTWRVLTSDEDSEFTDMYAQVTGE